MYNPQHNSPCQLLKNTRECLETTVKNLDKVRAEQHRANNERIMDNCQFCKGAKGGVKGNENNIGGVVICDYCTVLFWKAMDATFEGNCRTCDKLRCGNCIYGPHRTNYPKADNYEPAAEGGTSPRGG